MSVSKVIWSIMMIGPVDYMEARNTVSMIMMMVMFFVDDDVDHGEGDSDGDGDGYYLQAWTRLSSRGRQRDSTAQPTPPQCFSSESNWGVPKIVSIWSGSKVMIMAMMTWPGQTNGALGLILCSRDVVHSCCASTSKMKSFILSLLFSLQNVCTAYYYC